MDLSPAVLSCHALYIYRNLEYLSIMLGYSGLLPYGSSHMSSFTPIKFGSTPSRSDTVTCVFRSSDLIDNLES
jgi:hypothetical protein